MVDGTQVPLSTLPMGGTFIGSDGNKYMVFLNSPPAPSGQASCVNLVTGGFLNFFTAGIVTQQDLKFVPV